MDRTLRRSAVTDYKERKITAGIYALRCLATQQVWAGRAPDLSTIRNRLWFTLRQGANTHRTLQQAWRDHGEQAFTFEIVETLAEEDMEYSRDRMLKQRLNHWLAQLGAIRI